MSGYWIVSFLPPGTPGLGISYSVGQGQGDILDLLAGQTHSWPAGSYPQYLGHILPLYNDIILGILNDIIYTLYYLLYNFHLTF